MPERFVPILHLASTFVDIGLHTTDGHQTSAAEFWHDARSLVFIIKNSIETFEQDIQTKLSAKDIESLATKATEMKSELSLRLHTQVTNLAVRNETNNWQVATEILFFQFLTENVKRE